MEKNRKVKTEKLTDQDVEKVQEEVPGRIILARFAKFVGRTYATKSVRPMVCV